MRRIVFILFAIGMVLNVATQPQARRNQGEQQTAKSNANNITTRAQIAFPTTAAMSEDVVWRRDIYRELNLEDDANAGLYYPVEPVGTQMNLFTYLFKLMMHGNIKVYEYRLDGNESFDDSARVKPLNFLNNYHIYYERNNGRVRIDNSDIPSREVKGYYLKESAYYDQGTSTFHRKVIALCPIMMREDDFGEGAQQQRHHECRRLFHAQPIQWKDLQDHQYAWAHFGTVLSRRLCHGKGTTAHRTGVA